MSDLLKIAKEVTFEQMKNNIRAYSDKWSNHLFRYEKGVKKWYLYSCPICKEISSFPASEKDDYITDADGYKKNVLCPLCSTISKTPEITYRRIIGAGSVEADDKNVIIGISSIGNYPDMTVLKDCELNKLKTLDLYSFFSEIDKGIDDVTDYDSVYRNMLDCDDGINKSVVKAIFEYLPDEWGEREYLLAYLSFRDNPQILNVILEGSADAQEIVLKFYTMFFRGGSKKSDYTAIKLAVKKKPSAEEMKTGEVFTVPLNIAKECDSLEKLSSWRKFYKSNKGVGNDDILRASSISCKSTFINQLQIAVEKTGYTADQIANICLMQKLNNSRELDKTIKEVTAVVKRSKAGEMKSVDISEFYFCDVYNLVKNIRNNNWYINYYFEGNSEHCIRERMLIQKTLEEIEPEDEVIFQCDDMLMLERDIKRILEVCNYEAMRVEELIRFYKNDIAYLYTNEENTHYILVKKNGDIFFEGRKQEVTE